MEIKARTMCLILTLLLVNAPLLADDRQFVVYIVTDHACTLEVTDEEAVIAGEVLNLGEIKAGQTRDFTVSEGSPLFFTCKAGNGAEATITLGGAIPANGAIIEFELADRVQMLDQFEANQGIVLDRRTGLSWRQTDNGFGVNWSEAQSYCTSLGREWDLPTFDQLSSLPNVKFGAMRRIADHWVSPLFKLDGHWFWSKTTKMDPKYGLVAWGLTLKVDYMATDKEQRLREETIYQLSVSRSGPGLRALCVRSVK